jgi:hypothetical protein
LGTLSERKPRKKPHGQMGPTDSPPAPAAASQLTFTPSVIAAASQLAQNAFCDSRCSAARPTRLRRLRRQLLLRSSPSRLRQQSLLRSSPTRLQRQLLLRSSPSRFRRQSLLRSSPTRLRRQSLLRSSPNAPSAIAAASQLAQHAFGDSCCFAAHTDLIKILSYRVAPLATMASR